MHFLLKNFPLKMENSGRTVKPTAEFQGENKD